MRCSALALLLLSACVTAQGAPAVHEIDLEQFALQATTLDEVEAFLGQPLRAEGLENGSLIIDYALGDAWNQGSTVFLFFDSAHVLVGKAYIEGDVDEEKT